MPRSPDPTRKAIINRRSLDPKGTSPRERRRRVRGTPREELVVVEEREREYQERLRPPPLPWEEAPS